MCIRVWTLWIVVNLWASTVSFNLLLLSRHVIIWYVDVWTINPNPIDGVSDECKYYLHITKSQVSMPWMRQVVIKPLYLVFESVSVNIVFLFLKHRMCLRFGNLKLQKNTLIWFWHAVCVHTIDCTKYLSLRVNGNWFLS